MLEPREMADQFEEDFRQFMRTDWFFGGEKEITISHIERDKNGGAPVLNLYMSDGSIQQILFQNLNEDEDPGEGEWQTGKHGYPVWFRYEEGA